METPQRVGGENPAAMRFDASTDSRRLPKSETERADLTLAELSKTTPSQTRLDAMARFWVRFNELFGGRPADKWGAVVPKVWIEALADVSGELIVIGLNRAFAGDHEPDPVRRRQGWPPNPVAFRALCEPRPEDFNLPSEQAAYDEAVFLAGRALSKSLVDRNNKPIEPSHPAVWHAAHSVGLSLLTEYAESGRREFKRVWPTVVRMVMTGQQLTPIPKALMAPGQQSFRELTVEETEIRNRKRDESLAKLDAMFPRPSRAHAFGDDAQEASHGAP